MLTTLPTIKSRLYVRLNSADALLPDLSNGGPPILNAIPEIQPSEVVLVQTREGSFAMTAALVFEDIRNMNRGQGAKSADGTPAGSVMQSNRLHDGHGQAPQTQQIRPNIRMARPQHLLLSLANRNAFFARQGDGLAVFIGQVADHHQLANIMQQSSHENIVQHCFVHVFQLDDSLGE